MTDENIYDEWHNAPMTKAGKRLLQVMATIPPQGRKGLAWFVDAIEVEARNLGYADRLDAHINGRCDYHISVDRLAAALHAEECPPDQPGVDPWCPGVHADMSRAMAIARAYVNAGLAEDGGEIVPRSLRGTDLDPRGKP